MQDRFKLKCFNRLQNKMYEVRSISYYQGNVKRIEVEDNGKILIFDEYDNNIDNSILVQCTGLKDKNGKLIYEGDVVCDRGELERACNLPLRVVWSDRLCQFRFNHSESALRTELGTIDGAESHNYEVIGNIYENPELLEVEE